MDPLSKKSCQACRIDAPKLSEKEIDNLLPQIPEWRLMNVDGVLQLEREYIFKDFLSALRFTLAVGDAAEEEGHHPAILLEWGRVKINWWSHKIKGLHENDVIMSAKTDVLYVDNERNN